MVMLNFYRGLEENVLFSLAMSIEDIILEKIDWTTEKLLFFFSIVGKNDSEIKFTNHMWTFPGINIKKPQNF